MTEDVAWPPIWNYKRVNVDDDPQKVELPGGYTALTSVGRDRVQYQPQALAIGAALFTLELFYERRQLPEGHGWTRRVLFSLAFNPTTAQYREAHLTDPPDFTPISWYRDAFNAKLLSFPSQREVERFFFEPAALADAVQPHDGTLTNRTELSCALS